MQGHIHSLGRLRVLNEKLLSDALDVGTFMDSVSEEVRNVTSSVTSGIWIVGRGTLSIRTDLPLENTMTVRSIKIEKLKPEVRTTILSRQPVELVGGDRVARHAIDPGYVQATGLQYMYRRPVLDQGEIVAVLVAARDVRNALDAFEVEVMGVLSTQVALCVRAMRVALEIAKEVGAAKDAQHARAMRRVTRGW